MDAAFGSSPTLPAGSLAGELSLASHVSHPARICFETRREPFEPIRVALCCRNARRGARSQVSNSTLIVLASRIGHDIWTSLAGSSRHLASFDRRKCAVRSGPAGTGQQCPEGWTLYHLPGPLLQGTNVGSADDANYDWVDQFDTFRLGKNIPIATGTNSDSLLALQPSLGSWVVLRVPYPLGFYSRGLDGPTDDPNTRWKAADVVHVRSDSGLAY